MSDGEGEYVMDLVISSLERQQEVYAVRVKQTFPNRLHAVRLNLRIVACRIPDFGTYEATLLANGAWVAHRVFKILPKELPR